MSIDIVFIGAIIIITATSELLRQLGLVSLLAVGLITD